jgi:hypothetical protein
MPASVVIGRKPKAELTEAASPELQRTLPRQMRFLTEAAMGI